MRMNIEQSKEFMSQFVNVIKTRFPNSNIYFKRVNMFGVEEYQVRFYLAKNLEELSNKIEMNDAMNWCFSVGCIDGCINENDIVVGLNRNSIIRIANPNDPKEKYCVYGSVKVPYRKIKGNAESALVKLKKFVDKTAELLIDNADTINQGIIKGFFTVADKVK